MYSHSPLRPLIPWVVILIISLVVNPVQRYLVVPLRIRRKQSRPCDPNYVPVELTQLPQEISWSFARATPELAALGFRAAGHLAQSHEQGSLDSTVSVWVNQATTDIAQVIGVRAHSPKAMRVSAGVTFRTEFSDGTEIITTNLASPGVFPPDPRSDVAACADVHDLSLLYAFHRARVARDAGNRVATVAPAVDPAAYLRSEWVRTFDRLIQAGYYEPAPGPGVLQLTLKGAYLTVWRLLWPWKQINRSRRHRKADRLLRELGFGGPAVIVPAVHGTEAI